MFYVDIVKVFNGHIQKRYLKSTLFSWVFALATTLFFTCLYEYLIRYPEIGLTFKKISNQFNIDLFQIFFGLSQILPLVVNFCFYIIIVCSLFRSYKASTNTATSTWHRLYIATLIFILSDVIMLIDFFMSLQHGFHSNTTLIILKTVMYYFNLLVLEIYLVVLKCNRELWYDYMSKLNLRFFPTKRTKHGNNMNRV